MKSISIPHFGCAAVAILFVLATNSCKNKSGKDTKPAQENVGVVPAGDFLDGVNDQNRGDKSGPITLRVQFKLTDAAGQLVLYETEGKFNHAIDSARIEGSMCVFPEREFHRGIYQLALNGDKSNMHPIILNPDEREVNIGFNSKKLEGSLFSLNSVENKGLAAYHIHELILEKKIQDLKRERFKAEAKDDYDLKIAAEEKNLQTLREKIIAAYPGTFLAKLLTWKQEPYRHSKEKFWDNVDFSDESLVRTRVVHQRSQVFFQNFGGATENGLMNCIDIIVEKAKVNNVVLEATLFSILEGMSQTKYEGVCTYLLDNYIYGDGCGAELSEAVRSRSQGIRNVQVGQVPPNIVMPLLKGGTSNLYDTVSKNKYTLVMFWTSWCQLCQQESPLVVSVYDQFRSKGFEILGVSVDKDKSMWQDAVAKRKFTFPNVCGFEQWNSKVALDYKVVKTPVFFLLDREKKIVVKSTESMSAVKEYLEENLK